MAEVVLKSRTEIREFSRQLAVGKHYHISFRIATPDPIANLNIPFTTYKGIVLEQDIDEWTVEYSTIAFAGTPDVPATPMIPAIAAAHGVAPVAAVPAVALVRGTPPVPARVIGNYSFPPQMVEGGIIEVQNLALQDTPVPTMEQLRKRPRVDAAAPAAAAIPNDQLRQLWEFAKGQEMPKQKLQVCPRLKVEEGDIKIWNCFYIIHWMNQIRALPHQREGTIKALELEFSIMLVNAGIITRGKLDTEALKDYNDSRDAYLAWMLNSWLLPVTEKSSYELGFHLLGVVLSKMHTLSFGFKNNVIQQEWKTEFNTGSCDVAALCQRVFQSRRKGGPSGADTPSGDNRRQPAQKDPSAKLGTATASGAQFERQCNRCHKWTVFPTKKPDWRLK